MTPIVRRGTIDDLDQLAVLFDQYLVFYEKESNLSRHTQYLKERIENNEAVIFVTCDATNVNELIGFALIYSTFSSTRLEKMLILNDLYVLPTIRKGGVGKLLITSCIEHAKASNAAILRLRTAVDNTTAQGLYHKMGFIRDEAFYTYNINF